MKIVGSLFFKSPKPDTIHLSKGTSFYKLQQIKKGFELPQILFLYVEAHKMKNPLKDKSY